MGLKFQDKKEKDLFDQVQTVDKKIKKKTEFLLPKIQNSITLSYENTVFIIIGIIMACVIFFSLGVEKGRQDANFTEKVDIEIMPVRTSSYKYLDTEKPKESVRDSVKYVLQVASYQNKKNAEEELRKLRKEGYNAYIKESGQYYQLYVGSFSEKKDINRAFNILSKKYKDCCIKTTMDNIS